MNEIVTIYVAAILVSAVGVAAVVVNRFRKVLAGVSALMAAVCPWFMIGGFFTHWGWLRSQWPTMFGLFGAPPLFVIAFFLYGLGKVTPRRGMAAGASLIGMFIALGNTLLWFNLFSKME